MKLTQNIALTSDLGIKTWLSAPSGSTLPNYELLKDGVSFSFHPFSLRTWAACGSLIQGTTKADLIFSWRLMLIDDEEEKPLRRLKSPNRSLLLFSELLGGLAEVTKVAHFVIDSIDTDLNAESLNFHFRIAADTNGERILSGALLIRVAMDSLLFCRGLGVKESVFCSESDEKILPILKAILLSLI